ERVTAGARWVPILVSVPVTNVGLIGCAPTGDGAVFMIPTATLSAAMPTAPRDQPSGVRPILTASKAATTPNRTRHDRCVPEYVSEVPAKTPITKDRIASRLGIAAAKSPCPVKKPVCVVFPLM